MGKLQETAQKSAKVELYLKRAEEDIKNKVILFICSSQEGVMWPVSFGGGTAPAISINPFPSSFGDGLLKCGPRVRWQHNVDWTRPRLLNEACTECIGVSCASPKRYAQVLTPGTWEHTLFGNRVTVDMVKLRQGHTALGWVLNPVTGVLERRGRLRQRDTCREEGHVITETEIGLMQLHAKEWQGLLATKKGFSPRAFRGSQSLPKPWFQTSSLQDCEGMHCCCFKPPNLCNLLWQP